MCLFELSVKMTNITNSEDSDHEDSDHEGSDHENSNSGVFSLLALNLLISLITTLSVLILIIILVLAIIYGSLNVNIYNCDDYDNMTSLNMSYVDRFNIISVPTYYSMETTDMFTSDSQVSLVNGDDTYFYNEDDYYYTSNYESCWEKMHYCFYSRRDKFNVKIINQKPSNNHSKFIKKEFSKHDNRSFNKRMNRVHMPNKRGLN